MTNLIATYSPEDNKMRLYASAKLDDNTYARVKAAGFKWAPQQKLFVAPMWTPARHDLLVELCGEVSDEDTSLVHRAEQRAERFEDRSDNHAAEPSARTMQPRLLPPISRLVNPSSSATIANAVRARMSSASRTVSGNG